MFASPLGSTKIKTTIEISHCSDSVHFETEQEYIAQQQDMLAERFYTKPQRFPCIGIYIADKEGYCYDYKIVYWIYDFETVEQTE